MSQTPTTSKPSFFEVRGLPERQYEVCQSVATGLTRVLYRDKPRQEADKICQSLNDEAGERLPKHYVRIQRRTK